MELYKVDIIQGKNVVRLGFNKMSDAIAFAEQCLETGNRYTEIHIKMEKEEE